MTMNPKLGWSLHCQYNICQVCHEAYVRWLVGILRVDAETRWAVVRNEDVSIALHEEFQMHPVGIVVVVFVQSLDVIDIDQ